MLPAYDQGVETPFSQLGVAPVPVYAIAKNYYTNRTPLYSRLPEAPLGNTSFITTSDNFRPMLATNVNAQVAGDTTLTLSDVSSFMIGDVLEVAATGEAVLITADPNKAAGTIAVSRGYAGTTAGAIAAGGAIYLIANTSSGGENFRKGITRLPVTITQNAQVFLHAYEIGGSLASLTDYALPPGAPTVLGKFRMDAMQNCADDIERAIYYGRGVALTAGGTKPAMFGLRSLIVSNNVTAPTNASAYKPADLSRDTIQKAYAAGGNPDTLVVGTDWMTGLLIWGQPMVRIDAGATVFGVKLDVFEVPFLSGVKIIVAPLMRPGSAFCLSSSEIRRRVKRSMFDKPRGSAGDTFQGDIIAEEAIEVDNEAHHAYVTGITGFSAT